MPETSTLPPHAAPSRPSHLRQVNARGILQLLRAHTPCSKADLVRYSGLSAPTVSSGVAYLEALGLAESIGEGESSGGRPPGLLRFNASHGQVAAADIGGTRLRMMLADLNGGVMAQWSTVLMRPQKTPEGVCALIAEGLKVMCRQSGCSLGKVLHLTAGAPGITNARTGVVLSAPNLRNWHDVPLREMLESVTGIATSVENDTNLAAVGERWNGAAEGVDNFVFIAMGTGVGAGIFLRGELHHGAQWCAGEVGYFGVSGRVREPMQVRKTGQLERVIGGEGIEERWKERLRGAGFPAGSEMYGMRAPQIFDLARDGDPMAAEVMGHTAGLLADAVADIALLLNPEIVVLGGGVGAHPELCRATEALVHRHEFAQPELRSSSLGTQAQLFGAIAVGLRASEAHLLL